MKKNIKNTVLLLGFLILWQFNIFSQGLTCATSAPFCSDTTVSFQAGVGSGTYGSNIGCLGTTPNPAWYYFQVQDAGRINVHLWTVPARDLDFICWGPFNAGNIEDLIASNACGQLQSNCNGCQSHSPTNGANPVDLGGYPVGNIVDCSYSPQNEEYVHIPSAQTGQWYIFLITNYSNQVTNINFQRDSTSVGSSNCSIMLPAKAVGDIVCEGDTAKLTSAITNPNFTYIWSGPNGFSQIGPNPNVVFPHATVALSGTYSLVYSTPDSVGLPAYCQLLVHPRPVLSHPNDTIYFGQTETILLPSSYSYVWSTGFHGNPLVIVPNRTTQYKVTATSVFGCIDSLTVKVKVLNAPIINRSPDANHICQGINALANITFRMQTLACTSIAEYRYTTDHNSNWSNWTSYTSNQIISTDTLLGIQMRAYQLTCNDVGTLFNSDTTSIFWVIHPQITRESYIRIPEEDGICLGASLKLNVDTTPGIPIVMEYQYQAPTQTGWTSGNFFIPTDPGMGWIRARVASGSFGCLTTEWDWFAWLVQPQPQVQGLVSQQLCPNQSVKLIGDVIDGYGTNHYTWEKSTTNCNGVWDSIPTAHSAIYDTPILNSTAYYRLQVTQSGFNCKTTSNCVILQVNPLPDITIHSDTLVCNNVPLTIVSSVTGGAGVNHYQYQFRYTVTDSWSDIGIDDGTLFLNSLAQRTQFRCLLNQSGQGCADTSNSIWVNVHTIPLIINQPQASSVCIGGSTQFSISVTTNDTPTYQWFGPHGLINGATTPNVSINPVTAADSGYYHCEVMNSCFYAISDSVKLSILPTYIHPTAITGIDHRCKGTGWDAFSVDGQFPTTYLWSLAPSVAGTINPATGLVTWNATWDGVAAITYKSSGCGLSDSVTVFVNTILPVENPTTITGEPYRCQGWGTSQYSTIATNDTGFVWSIVSAGLSQIDQNTGLVTWDQMFNGTATISVYARGCYGPSAVISKNVDVLHAPVMFITESLNRCEGENASFMVNHYDTNMIFRYQWFGPNGLIMGANDSIFNISPVSLVDSGTYYCQVSAYCGDAQSPPAELTIHHRPMVSFMATPKCMRDTVYFANASTADDMPLTSLWYFGDGDSSQLFSPAHIYPDSITYTVRLIEENAFGCKDSSSLVIQSFALPFFTLTATNDSCFGQSNGTILVNVTNGLMPFSYAINNISPQDTNWFSALPGGLYTITVLDSNKCAVKDTISVIEPPRIKSQYDKTDVKCYSDSTGAIQLAIIGGVKPYTFVWSNGDTTQNLSQIPIGYYSVLISDAFGCKNSYDSIFINQPNPLVIDSIVKPVSCNIVNDAMIAVYPEGGYGFYTYLWSDNSTKDTLQNLAPGNYAVTITDENGCTHVSNYKIHPNPENCWDIYTSFSPNGDGQNDLWNIPWSKLYPNMIIQVFNRWGNIVFENKGEFHGWDGTGPSGKQLPPETYYFVINLNDGTTAIQTGTVTIFY